MSLFRSKEMGYFDIILPRESAWDIMNILGELDAIEFIDLNQKDPTFNRPYS